MPSLSQSPLLQALGYAIAHSLWQMAMVWIVYVLLNSFFKFKSETKYRIAVASQVVGFAWFIGTLQFYYTQSSNALKAAEALYLESGDQNAIVFTAGKTSLLSFFIKAEQVLPYLSVAYLLLLAFLTIRWFRNYRYTQLVRLNGLQKIDVDWKLFVKRVSAQLGIKQKVNIFLSELVQSPVTIGFLKPVILIPVASITHLTAQQLEAVILHELAHIKRHDYLLNIVLSIIDLGLFFNPFTRLITKSVSKERENSCDDWVLQYQYSPAMYAEALLRIAVMQKMPAMAMYAAKTKSELASRVQRMINKKDGRFSYRHQLIALLLMTGILVSIAWYDPNAMKTKEIKPTAENKAVVLEPLAARIDNPLFNPMFFLNDPLKEEVKKNVEASQKQMHKLRKETQLAVRDITLPEVMAPVAIENLKELERNLNSTVNKQVKRRWYNANAVPAGNLTAAQAYAFENNNGQNNVFRFDTLKFNNAFSLNDFAEGNNWVAFTDHLKASEKSIEMALKNGKISQLDAKKMQAEIADAFKNLKTMKLPQVYSFVQGDDDGGNYYFKMDEDYNNDNSKDKVKADEKRRSEQKEKYAAARIRRMAVDTTKHRLIARTVPTPPVKAGVLHNGIPYVVVNGVEVAGYTNAPKAMARLQANYSDHLKQRKAEAAAGTGYSYVYADNNETTGEECDKANNINRQKHTTTVTGANAPKSSAAGKGTKATSKKSCNVQVVITPPVPETEPVLLNIDLE